MTPGCSRCGRSGAWAGPWIVVTKETARRVTLPRKLLASLAGVPLNTTTLLGKYCHECVRVGAELGFLRLIQQEGP